MIKSQFEKSDDGNGSVILMADCPNCNDAVIYNDGCVKCDSVFEFEECIEAENLNLTSRETIKELFKLWETLADVGELSVSKEFIKTYKLMKSNVESLSNLNP